MGWRGYAKRQTFNDLGGERPERSCCTRRRGAILNYAACVGPFAGSPRPPRCNCATAPKERRGEPRTGQMKISEKRRRRRRSGGTRAQSEAQAWKRTVPLPNPTMPGLISLSPRWPVAGSRRVMRWRAPHGRAATVLALATPMALAKTTHKFEIERVHFWRLARAFEGAKTAGCFSTAQM